MSHFLLYSNPTCETGRVLADALGIPRGGTPPAEQVDVLIRWGATDPVAINPKKVINNKKAILAAADKFGALKTMWEGGVSIPAVFPQGDFAQFPCLGRKVSHTGGTDIVLCLQRADVKRALDKGCTYFVQYIPTAREYRVHVFGDRIIKVSQKRLTGDPGELSNVIRNLEQGYTFHVPSTALRPQDEEMAIKAVSSLGLDFGAVDMVISDDGDPYVLEVNTGPGLVEGSQEIYVAEFSRILQEYGNYQAPNSTPAPQPAMAGSSFGGNAYHYHE